MKDIKIELPVDDLPRSWYNIIPDLPQSLPPPKEPQDGSSRLEFLSEVVY
jgi:tryptophan synthase beta chain